MSSNLSVLKTNIHDGFIKNTSTTLGIPESDVMQVITYQWKSAKEATITGSTIELSGMGRFVARMNKVEIKKQKFTNIYNAAVRELEKYTKDDVEWYPAYKRVKSAEKELEFLNTKEKDPTLIAFRADKENRKERAKQRNNETGT